MIVAILSGSFCTEPNPVAKPDSQTLSSNPASTILFKHIGQMDLGSAYIHIISPVNIDSVIDQCYLLVGLISHHTTRMGTMRSKYTKPAIAALQRMHTISLEKMAKLSQTLSILNLPDETVNPFHERLKAAKAKGQLFNQDRVQWWGESQGRTDLPVTQPTTAARDKRQVAIIFGLLGLGTGIYNTIEIAALHDQVDNLAANQEVIVREVELHRRAINALGKAVDNIYATTARLIKDLQHREVDHIVQECVQNMEYATTMVVTQVDEMVIGLTHLMHNQLHPNFVDMDTVTREFKNIDKALGEVNMRLFNSHPGAVYHYPLSVFRRGNELKYMLHIPISTHLEQLQIMKFIPTPFHLGNFTATINVRNPILIIDDHATFYAERPKDFLEKCIKSENNYHCTGESIYNKDTKKSCLARLYSHDLQDIEQHCDVEVSERGEVIQQLTPNRFRILSEQPTQVGVTCKGGISDSPYKMMIKGNHTMDLNATCEVTTKHHVFTSSVDLFEHYALVNLSIDLTSTIIEPEVQDVELSQLLDILNETRRGPHKFVPLKEFKSAIRKHRSSLTHNLRKYVIEIVVFIIISLVIVLFIAYYGKPLFYAMKRGRANCLGKKKKKSRVLRTAIEMEPLNTPSAPPPPNRTNPTITLNRLRQATIR